jgi:hypothetical protein
MDQEKYGLFKGMNDITYHFERDEISNSALKVIHKKTLAHYYYQFLDPDHKAERLAEKLAVMSGENTKKSHLRFGDCFHVMLLEPDHFKEKVVLWNGLPRNTKAGKEAFAEALQQLKPGMRTMTEQEYKDAKLMCSSVMSLSKARAFLEKEGDAELSFFWRDEVHEVDCKARMDFVTQDGFIVDVKTAANADHETFRKDAFNFGYYMQAAFYMRAYAAVMGKEAQGFCFVVVEKEQPFGAAPYYATEEEIMLGNYHLDQALEKYAEAKKRGSWPAYEDKFVALGLPPWGMKMLEEG